MSENFMSLWWKLCPWHAFKVRASSASWWLSTFVKGIISDKSMNLCEIGLFHRVWSVSKASRDNYHGISWKCLWPQYISIYKFWGWQGLGIVHGPPYIFCLLLKKRKKCKSITYTKIKFYIILISIFFLGWTIKKLRNWGAKNIRRGRGTGAGVDVTERQWAGWRPVIPQNLVDNILAFHEGGDSVPELIKNNYPLFPNTNVFILQIQPSPRVSSLNGEINCIMFKNNGFKK